MADQPGGDFVDLGGVGISVRARLDKLGGDFQKARKTAEDEGRRMGHAMGQGMTAGTEGFFAKLKGFFFSMKGLAVTFFAGVAARVTSELFKAGSAVSETRDKFTATFGDASDSVDEFLGKWAHMAGLTRQEGRELTATAGAIAQGMGFSADAAGEFSVKMAKLAGDITSFDNAAGGTAETMHALQSGIAGEAEALKRFGIILRQTEVEQRALKDTGKRHADELTKQERAMATLAIVTEQSAVKLGNLEDTQNSNANRARALGAAMRDLWDVFAFGMVPAFSELLSLGTPLTDEFSAIERVALGLGKIFGILVGTVSTLIQSVRGLAEILVGGLTIAITGAFRAALGLVEVLARLTKSEGLQKWVDDAKWRADRLTFNAQSQMGQGAKRFTQGIPDTWRRIFPGEGNDFQRRTTATPPVDPAVAAAAEEAARKAAEKRKDIEEQLADQIRRINRDTTDELLAELQRLEDAYKAAGGEVTGLVAEQFQTLRTQVKQAAEFMALQAEAAKVEKMSPGPEQLKAWDAVKKKAAELQAAVDPQLQLWADIDAFIQEAAEQMKNLQAASVAAPIVQGFEQQMAKLREDLARGLIDEDAFRQKAEQLGKVFNRAILEQIDALRSSGQLSDETYQALVSLLKDTDTDKGKREQRLQDLREQSRTIAEMAGAALQFANALGLVDDQTEQVLNSIVQVGTSVARLAAGDLTAIPTLLGGIAGLFGGGDDSQKKLDEERKRQAEAIKELTQQLKDLGREIGPITQAIRQARDLYDQVRTELLPDVFPGSATHMTPTGRTASNSQLTEAQKQYEEALKRIKASVLEDLALAQMRATGTERDIQLKELELEQQKRRQDLEESGLLLDKEVADALKEVEAAELDLLRQRLAAADKEAAEDARVRLLRAKGQEEAATMLQLQLSQERELENARQQGLSESTIAAIEAAQAEERLAAARELARAKAEKEADFTADLEKRIALLRGDTAGAQAIELQRQRERELEAARALVEQGVITEDMFAALAKVLDEELAQALQDTADAAEAAAAAAEQDLELRKLEAEGKDQEAARRKLELQHEAELQAAKDRGASDDFIRRLLEVQALEMQKLLGTGGGSLVSDVTGAAAQNDQLVQAITRISSSEAQTLVTLQRTGISLDRERNAILRALLGKVGGQAYTFNAGGVTIQGAAAAGDANAAVAASGSALEVVDRGLARRVDLKELGRGQLVL